MNIQNLIIEITRKCNMTCDHCLRGDAENKNIDRGAIYDFLNKNEVTYINSITFTGGEPSLNVQAIKDFISICKELNIEVGNFYLATNGKIASNDFIITLLELKLFCTDNEISQVEISNDIYHDCCEQNEQTIKKLENLKFVNKKDRLKDKYLIDEGRANENGIGCRIIETTKWNQYDSIEDIEQIYLNVNGDILTACDLSYNRQEEEKIGNVYDNTLEEIFETQKELVEEVA